MNGRPVQKTMEDGRAKVDRLRPMLRKLVQRRFVLGEQLLSWQELWDIAEDAVNEALASHDPTRSKWSTYAHYKADWALLGALSRAGARVGQPEIQKLRAAYEYAQRMLTRGRPLHDGAEEMRAELDAAMDELAAVFGLGLAPSPEETYALKETAREVQSALDTLSEHNARLLRMRFLESRTLESTARALGMSASQVHRDESRALQQLQAVLRSRGVEPGDAAEGEG